MSKKDKKKLSAEPEFSLNSEPEKRKKQDNGFFFENAPLSDKAEVNDKGETRFKTEAEGEVKAESETEEKAEVKTEEKVEVEAAEDKENVQVNVEEPVEEKLDGNKGSANKESGASSFAYFFKIAGVLTLICSFVALMLASVNMITKDTIASNTEKQKTAAVTQIFTDADDAFLYEDYLGEEEIYLATKDGKLYGYCVSVFTEGYGGEIFMMVGIRYDGTVQGVKIVSMSETAGLGSKTKNDSFLNQYISKKGPFTVGENVDAVAGATISSKAVTAGVNAAFDLAITPASIAARNGMLLYGAEEVSSETESENAAEQTKADVDTTANIGVPQMETNASEGTHIDPASAGQYQTNYYYQQDKSYTWNRENGHYLEKETTDTESETEEVSDGEI